MRVLAVASVLLLALLAAACGDDDADVAAEGTGSTVPPTATEPTDEPVTLEATIPEQVDAGPVTWSFDVVNTTDEPVTLTFTSGQEGDAQLIADDGEVVHTWSADRSFIQALQERELGPGERFGVTLDDDLSGVAPGTYTLELTLTVQDPPLPVQQAVDVVGR